LPIRFQAACMKAEMMMRMAAVRVIGVT
jgi:hypothetical protein